MLSRRLKLGATRSKTEPTTPASEPEDPADCPELHFHDVAPAQAKRRRRYTWLVFVIGGLAGLLLAGAAAKNQDMISMELLRELSLDSFIDVIPAGILKEASDISQLGGKNAVNYDAFSTGLALKAAGFEAVHPVVMVPGVISTGLVMLLDLWL